MRLTISLSASLAGLALVLFAACDRGAGPAGEGTRLVYWPPPGEYDVKLARALVDRWNAAHPDIQVEMQPLPAGRSSEEVLLASIVGGTTPDVCSNILTGTVERMVRAGAIVPLSDQPGFEGYVRARSPPGTLEQFRSRDGKVYQLPYKANPQMLIYNRTLFTEAGVRPPRTYSEFLEAAARLTRDRDGDGRTDQWAVGLVIDNTWFKRWDDLYPLYTAASDGDTLLRDGKVRFDGPAMVGTVRFLREIFAKGYAPRSFFTHQLFLQGRLAMTPGSAPNIPGLEAHGGVDYDFMPWPVPDGHRGPVYAFGDIKSIVIFSTTRNRAAAWAFLQYLTSAQADLELMTTTGQFPLRRDLATTPPFSEYLAAHPRLGRMAHHLDHIRATDDTVHLVEMLDVLSQMYETAVLYGLKSPERAVKDAAARVQRVVDLWK